MRRYGEMEDAMDGGWRTLKLSRLLLISRDAGCGMRRLSIVPNTFESVHINQDDPHILHEGICQFTRSLSIKLKHQDFGFAIANADNNIFQQRGVLI